MTFFNEWSSFLVVRKRTKCLCESGAENNELFRCCVEVNAPKLTQARAEEYAKWFKVVADPIRIRILNLLASNESAVCVCDVVKHFPVGQPAISHHLKILRDARFVLVERRGTFMYYRVNRKCLAEFPHAAHLILNV